MDNAPRYLLLTFNTINLFVLPFFPLITEKFSENLHLAIFVRPYAKKKYGKKNTFTLTLVPDQYLVLTYLLPM